MALDLVTEVVKTPVRLIGSLINPGQSTPRTQNESLNNGTNTDPLDDLLGDTTYELCNTDKNQQINSKSVDSPDNTTSPFHDTCKENTAAERALGTRTDQKSASSLPSVSTRSETATYAEASSALFKILTQGKTTKVTKKGMKNAQLTKGTKGKTKASTVPPKAPIKLPKHRAAVACSSGRQQLRCAADDCLHDGSPLGTFVQCSLCFSHFHLTCVGLDENNCNFEFWPCKSCRSLSQTVKKLRQDMEHMIQCVNDCKEEKIDLARQLQAKSSECEALRTENAVLSERLRLHSSQQSVLSENTRVRGVSSAETTKKVLLIGGSIIRSVRPYITSGVELCVLPGARLKDVTSNLRSRKHNKMYENVIIHAGTNDCSTNSSVESLLADAENMLIAAKGLSINGAVTFSSICPRNDKEQYYAKCCALNSELQSLCGRLGVSFVDNSLTFTFRDNSVDPAVIGRDGLHLNAEGGRRLARNLTTYGNADLKIPTEGDKPKTVRAKSPKQPKNVSAKTSNEVSQKDRQDRRYELLDHRQERTNRRPPQARKKAHATYGWTRRAPVASRRPAGSYYPSRTDWHDSPHDDTYEHRWLPCEICGLKSHTTQECWYNDVVPCVYCSDYNHSNLDCPRKNRS